MGYTPSQDQVAAQLRTVIPAVAAVLTAYGFVGEAGWVSTSLLVVGPISILVCSGWSLAANTREAIMRKASKPAAPGMPAPQIVLPATEKDLAEKLPDNVTAIK